MDYYRESSKSQSPLLPSQISIDEVKNFMRSSDFFPRNFQPKKAEESGPVSGDVRKPDSGLDSSGERSESLLHLNSNICTEIQNKTADEKTLDGLTALLSPYSRKVAFTLQENVKRLIDEAPDISYLGFLTLTFKENITCPKEASKRFKSFNSHFLSKSKDFGNWLAVRERQGRGAWHYHMLVRLPYDIKTGFLWDVYDHALKFRDKTAPYRSKKNQIYRKIMSQATKSASPRLRQYWQELRLACSKYGFGRSEMLPIKSNIKAMTLYVGKYVSKELGERDSRDKGVRLVNYSQGWIKNSPKFQWNSDGSREWRRKLMLFSRLCGCGDLYNLNKKLGSSWAYHYLDDIIRIDEFIEKNKLNPESVQPRDIPEELNLKMLKHLNVREAKKIKICPGCKRKARFQWQDKSLYCASCGALIF